MLPEGFEFDEFHDPWLWLLAVPGLVFVIWSYRRKKGEPAVVYPTLASFRGLPKTLRQRLRVTLPLLQALAVILLAGAAARPRKGDSRTEIKDEGIAIQMVLDRSGSMEEAMEFDGRTRKRIDIVKQVFAEFVSGNEEKGLPGRKTDRIGLTTFAALTQENCPLVGQHEDLLAAVKNLRTEAPWVDQYGQRVWREDLPESDRAAAIEFRKRRLQNNPLSRTAIGDGLERAVLSLITAESDLSKDEDFTIKGKVIILLTDGENNWGETSPKKAGDLARANDIRVYYIRFQEQGVEETIFGRRITREYSRDDLLREARAVTGDPERAFLATDSEALRDIYRQIDQLERTDLGKIEYRSYEEKFHLFLLPGFACAFLALLLGETALRRSP